ncbi:hypothetical protein FOCC_FOCC004617 [Frankliniella occidentalis]|nr:hypothetical protein FOCC_FOCC004617 [Frankliniella occidentalis]
MCVSLVQPLLVGVIKVEFATATPPNDAQRRAGYIVTSPGLAGPPHFGTVSSSGSSAAARQLGRRLGLGLRRRDGRGKRTPSHHGPARPLPRGPVRPALHRLRVPGPLQPQLRLHNHALRAQFP